MNRTDRDLTGKCDSINKYSTRTLEQVTVRDKRLIPEVVVVVTLSLKFKLNNRPRVLKECQVGNLDRERRVDKEHGLHFMNEKFGELNWLLTGQHSRK